jgi:hypothetical protein
MRSDIPKLNISKVSPSLVVLVKNAERKMKSPERESVVFKGLSKDERNFVSSELADTVRTHNYVGLMKPIGIKYSITYEYNA